jgi:hypothetical protein
MIPFANPTLRKGVTAIVNAGGLNGIYLPVPKAVNKALECGKKVLTMIHG